MKDSTPFVESVAAGARRLQAGRLSRLSILLNCCLFTALPAYAQPKVIRLPGIGAVTLPIQATPTQPQAPAEADDDATERPSQTSRYPQSNQVGAPTGRWGAGAGDISGLPESWKIRYPATQAEALQCNTVLDVGRIAQMNHSSDARFNSFINPDKARDSMPLWELIIRTNARLRALPSEQAQGEMYALRDKHTSNNLNRYLDHIDVLVRDYRNCQSKGMIRSG